MTKVDDTPSVTGDRSALLAALTVSSVVEARNTIPILSNMVVEAEGDTLRLTATDMDIAVSVTVPAAGAAFATTVDAKRLAGLVQSFDEGSQVRLALVPSPSGSGQRLEVKSGRSKFNLPTLPREDFPLVAFEPGPIRWDVAGKVLASLLDRLAFAQSDEEVRYYLNGIFLHRRDVDGRMEGAATDGKILAAAIATEAPDGWPGVILPKKVVATLRRMLKDVDATVEVALTEAAGRIRLAWGEWTVTAKLIDGSFPDFTRIIPGPNEARQIVIDGPGLVRGAKRVSGVVNDKTSAVAVLCAKDRLTLQCQCPESGMGEEEVPADCAIEAFRLGVSRRYLVDMLEAASGDSVRVTMPDNPKGPIRFEPAVGDDFIGVVMPMNV